MIRTEQYTKYSSCVHCYSKALTSNSTQASGASSPYLSSAERAGTLGRKLHGKYSWGKRFFILPAEVVLTHVRFSGRSLRQWGTEYNLQPSTAELAWCFGLMQDRGYLLVFSLLCKVFLKHYLHSQMKIQWFFRKISRTYPQRIWWLLEF